jgi:hypothetical protein
MDFMCRVMDTSDPTWISHGNERKTSTYIWWKLCGFQVDAIWTPCRFYTELCALHSMWIPDGLYVWFYFLRIPCVFPCGFMWNAL